MFKKFFPIVDIYALIAKI